MTDKLVEFTDDQLREELTKRRSEDKKHVRDRHNEIATQEKETLERLGDVALKLTDSGVHCSIQSNGVSINFYVLLSGGNGFTYLDFCDRERYIVCGIEVLAEPIAQTDLVHTLAKMLVWDEHVFGDQIMNSNDLLFRKTIDDVVQQGRDLVEKSDELAAKYDIDPEVFWDDFISW